MLFRSIWFGTVDIASAGIVYVFIDWTRRFFMPLRDLSQKYSVMQSSMASTERILELLDSDLAIQDPTAPVIPATPMRPSRLCPPWPAKRPESSLGYW